MQHSPSASSGRLRTPTGISLAAGCAAAVGAAVVAGGLFADGETAARAAVMAVMIGIYAAKVTDLRAVLGVTGVAMLLFVGFLVNDLGELTLHSGTWPYLIPLGFAAALGWGQHWMRVTPPTTRHADDGGDPPQPDPDAGASRTDGSPLHGGQRLPMARLARARARTRRPARARQTQDSA